MSTSPLVMNSCRPLPIGTRMSACRSVADLERSLVGAGDQHHIGAHHVTDGAGEQRVVRTPEHEGVDVGIAYRREQPFREHVHLVGLDVARLDELDETRAGRAGQQMSGANVVAARW